MNEAVEYWDNLFRGLDPETMNLSKSLPASVLPGFCDRYLKKGDREITDLVGEENIISFDHSGNGGRTVMCR